MMSTMDSLVADAMERVEAKIEQYQLETLKHYPTDVQKDRAELLRLAMPGAKFAWKVGHTGTHLWALGLHPRRNAHVTYVTRDSASDRFFLLEFFADRVKLTEKTALEFEALERTPIPYQQEGGNDAFAVVRNGQRIGTCRNEFTGNMQQARYRSTITPAKGLSVLDREALREFANFSVVGLAHTLFVAQEEVWAEPVSL